mmetsp:Transcript_14563/g.20700  ORF Transcript_14563/g.20700 Transcript_14563/m.20700 type:complete len:397 (-) Transcript_14563:71-1261(-)
MDTSSGKKVMIIVGDFVEDYEIYCMFQIMCAYGYKVDAICPDKKIGDICRTAVHDFLPGFQTYCELPGHNFSINADFEESFKNIDSYDGLYIPGGRSPEYLSLNPKVKEIVAHFFKNSKPVSAICHGPQIIGACGLLKGIETTAYPAIKAQCELAGGKFVSADPITMSHTHNNYCSAAAWPGHPELMKSFAKLLGTSVRNVGGGKKVLCLAGDFMEDLEIMVPFQGLVSMGHAVDVVCPEKTSGEVCATAIHDFEGDQTYTEKRGHNFKLNADFEEACQNISLYDALLIPGGRAPEYLCTYPKVLEIVRHFFEKNKPVASICHGQIILAAAGVLNGRKCTCYPAVQPCVESAGAEYIVPEPINKCFTDGNLVTGAAWPAHPEFIRQFSELLGTEIN